MTLQASCVRHVLLAPHHSENAVFGARPPGHLERDDRCVALSSPSMSVTCAWAASQRQIGELADVRSDRRSEFIAQGIGLKTYSHTHQFVVQPIENVSPTCCPIPTGRIRFLAISNPAKDLLDQSFMCNSPHGPCPSCGEDILKAVLIAELRPLPDKEAQKGGW